MLHFKNPVLAVTLNGKTNKEFLETNDPQGKP